MESDIPTYVIIGGGIAGVSCSQTLKTISSVEKAQVLLLSSSSVVKSVANLNFITRNITEFDVVEKGLEEIQDTFPGVRTKCCNVSKILPDKKLVVTDKGENIPYTKLCVCTGAKPNIINENCPHVIGIRDTHTVAELESRLKNAQKVVVVGNGGIAMELVYGLKNIEVVWVVRDKAIGNTFFDCGAAEFLLSEFQKSDNSSSENVLQPDLRRAKYTVFNLKTNSASVVDVLSGSALGPDWHENVALGGTGTKNIMIEYECEVTEFDYKGNNGASDIGTPLIVTLSNGKKFECDFLISATGVTPNIDLFRDFEKCKIAEDGGVEVDSNMRVLGLDDIYAAGDVCHCAWTKSQQWFQMRLWMQARQMGIFSAQCMVANHEKKEDPPLDFCSEVFAHATRFFGYKVVLLGKFNAQGLEKDKTQLVVRVTPGKEYVKVVLYEGKMYGAVLIGETDLEETFENLILNGMDLSHYGENLLHPDVELEDYFD